MLAHPPEDPATKYVAAELDALRAMMPEGEWMLLVAELDVLMHDAESGDLQFVREWDGRRVGDVEQMMAAPSVLELRFSTTTGTKQGNRKVRLYFSEPEELPEALVALRLATKPPGRIGLTEQTQHAREAAFRGDRYVAEATAGMS